MARVVAVWNGSQSDLADLLIAMEHNEAKAAILDQRFIDGVLFARFLLAQLLAEEEKYPDLSPEMADEDGWGWGETGAV